MRNWARLGQYNHVAGTGSHPCQSCRSSNGTLKGSGVRSIPQQHIVKLATTPRKSVRSKGGVLASHSSEHAADLPLSNAKTQTVCIRVVANVVCSGYSQPL